MVNRAKDGYTALRGNPYNVDRKHEDHQGSASGR